MTVEQTVMVRLAGKEKLVARLVRDIRSATKRAKNGLPGERTDILRVEALSAQLEYRAATQLARHPADGLKVRPSTGLEFCFVDRDNLSDQDQEHRVLVRPWIEAGDIAVELHFPLASGSTPRSACLGELREPEEAWEASDGLGSKAAVAERFTQQVAATLTAQDPPAFIEPSGVSNSVLTDTLREYVTMPGTRVDAPVRYQDGSVAEPFPLRSVSLQPQPPKLDRQLRLALLSIRHTEMDVEVDGCWLRNFDISRQRPQAETDQLAYETSIRQLETLTASRPLLIWLYQTGLQPAIVGFYRAVAHRLIVQPGSIAIVPMYFQHPPARPGSAEEAVVNRESFFSGGRPWWT